MGTNTSMSKVIHSTSIMKVNHKSITMAIELKIKYGARMYYKYLANAFNQTIHTVSTLKGARAYASEMLEASFPYGLIELTK